MALPLAVLLLVSACHLDAPFGIGIGETDNIVPPPVPPTTITGQFSTDWVPGANVGFYLGEGSPVEGLSAQVGPDGTFSVEISGTRSFNNLLVYAATGAVALMGIVPEVPRAASVWDLPQTVSLAEQAPEMNPIDADATTIALLIEGKLRQQGSSLSDATAGVVRRAITEIDAGLSSEPFATFRDMVGVLLTAAADQAGSTIPVFLPPNEIRAAGSSLNVEFLTTYAVDYDEDGTDDTTVDAYETALSEAMVGINLNVCFDPDLIRVVFMVDWTPPLLDGNCSERDREKWLDNIDPGETMHLVGGVHESMVRCEDEPDYEFCATQDDIQMTNEALGDWSPNLIRMFDDGTNGDAEAGDGIFTRAFALPRGMRIGYKYTWGPDGALWTGTEEWPGNQRLLEFVDQNGDGMVVRYDPFGDEATNKDRANQRTPANGGRGGNVVWDCGGEACCAADQSSDGVAGCVDADRDGYADYHEAPVDLDGDCLPDAFAPPGPNTPIVVECPE